MSSLLDLHYKFTIGSECTPQNHRWAMISCVAALLGREVYFPFGHANIYPNMYVLLVGLPATRKSTAIKIAENVLRKVGYDYFAFSRSSREKFLLDFSEGFNNRNAEGEVDMLKSMDVPFDKKAEDYTRCFICIDEFIDFIKQGNSDFLTLLTTMYDNSTIPYRERLKNSKSVSIHNPTVNVLAGLTPTSLSMVIPAEMIGQGYTSRLIMVHSGRPDKKITFPKPPDEVLEKEIIDKLTSISKLKGEMKLSADAEILVDSIYQDFVPLNDTRLQHYCSRRLIHLLKLSMIMAATNESLVITTDHVEEANTLLAFTENSMHLALGEFGEAKLANATQAIMEMLTQTDRPLSIEEIFGSVSNKVNKFTDVYEIVSNLHKASKVLMVDVRDPETGSNMYQIELNREIKLTNTIGINYERWIPEYLPT